MLLAHLSLALMSNLLFCRICCFCQNCYFVELAILSHIHTILPHLLFYHLRNCHLLICHLQIYHLLTCYLHNCPLLICYLYKCHLLICHLILCDLLLRTAQKDGLWILMSVTITLGKDTIIWITEKWENGPSVFTCSYP